MERGGIVEGFVEGIEMNGIVIARGGEAEVVTLSDRLRPPGIGFGVGWIHVYPASAIMPISSRSPSASPPAVWRRSACATESRSRS